MPSLEQAIRHFSRSELERLAQYVIDRLDHLDGDFDLEPIGDEYDGTGAEDDFAYLVQGARAWEPGCPISDAV